MMNSPSIVVLVNLNAYLGGGETLMVRFAEYLQRKDIEFLCVCAAGSYALADLQRKGVKSSSILSIEMAPDYYYADQASRNRLVDVITTGIRNRPARIVSFCMRDLYTVSAVCSKLSHAAVIHLILHIQDDLYVGQTIFEKLIYYITGWRRFGNSHVVDFNRSLLNILNEKGGLICMADQIAEVWRRNFDIIIPPERIIPLPSFVEPTITIAPEANNFKIIWIGRLVDFKIPALLAMIDFLGVSKDYIFTIVGAGDRSKILARMKDRGVNSERVNFVGEVSYVELGDVICGHAIGYAMGTSLIELARFRIPVIVALASYSHSIFHRPICGGLFFDQPRGCDGSELAVITQDEIGATIADAISLIEADWTLVADQCYAYARDNYAVEENFSAYKTIIQNTSWFSAANKAIKIPKASLARIFLYSLNNWMQK